MAEAKIRIPSASSSKALATISRLLSTPSARKASGVKMASLALKGRHEEKVMNNWKMLRWSFLLLKALL